MRNPELTLLHVHSTAIGYGRYGVKLAEALTAAGVSVYDEHGEHLTETTKAYERHLQTDDPAELRYYGEHQTNVVCWVSVPTHARGWWKGQYPVMSTMFEANMLPEPFRENLHNFAQVIVPCEMNRELFSQYHIDVQVVPLGVDPLIWHYEPRQPPTTHFRFLHAGSGYRKGPDLVHRAFRTVFRHPERFDPVPTLVLKSPRGGGDWHGPYTEVVSGRIPTEAEVDVYRSAHAYLQPSRGEGFGLQPLQAIAQGLPTVLTGAHGHAEYAHLGIPLSTTMVDAEYFTYGNPPGMQWWEPDFEELCEAMWDIYNNYETHLERAERSAKVVANEWTWADTARKFCDVIGGELTKPFSGTDEWVTPSYKLYPVVTERDHWCQIAGQTYFFEKGKEYFEVADVKRLLYESNLLDPRCLDATIMRQDGRTVDVGLDERQAAQIPNYSARHSYCRECGQQLNTRPTRADAEMAWLINEREQ